MVSVKLCSDRWRRQEFSVGGGTKARTHGERAEREPIWGSGDRAPSGVHGQSPWWGGQGASPPEAESSLASVRPSDEANLHHFRNFAKSQNHIYFLTYILMGLPRDYFFQPRGSSAAFVSIPAEPRNIITILDE